MSLKQYQIEKDSFLQKAYEAVIEFAPESPLSVSLDPKQFGLSIGYDEAKTTRIMTDLIADGYVTSSLGLGMLMVTTLGQQYLLEVEDDIITSSLIDNTNENPKIKTTTFMKQSTKLDLILKELYKFKNDGKYHSIQYICEIQNIPLDSSMELNKLAHRLKNDGYIKAIFTRNDCNAELTSYGIEYCEENSYTYFGQSIIENNYNISVVNSPNSNVVSQSSNVTITQNLTEVQQAVDRIRETVSNDSSIESERASDILECLNEIQSSLSNNNKPKFAITSLINLASGIASIGSWVTTLGQFAGVIPVLGG